MDPGKSGRRRGQLWSWLILAAIGIGACVLLLAFGLMFTYDLRHPGIYDCAPIEAMGTLKRIRAVPTGPTTSLPVGSRLWLHS